MFDKTIIIVSGMVDATIKEYQPDVDFRIFRTVEDLGNYLDKNPLRAQTMYITKDVIGGVNSTFTYLRNLVTNNDYLSVDNIVYLTEEKSDELESLRYLIDEFELSNWEIITGTMSRAFITEIVNGTFRGDRTNVKHKAVYRKPRQEYVKSKLKEYSTMEEDYPDDEHDLSNIPDEDVPLIEVPAQTSHLDYVYIAGLQSLERTAFTLIAAQYIALNSRVILIESDPDYHTLTECATKANVDATYVTITKLYEDTEVAIEIIKNSEKNLVIVSCIDRIDFDYEFISQLLYYNLSSSFDYIISEIPLESVSTDHFTTIVVPSTVLGTLATGEKVDKSVLGMSKFVGVNLNHLPEIHINSGVVVSTILEDILTAKDIQCPVITINSLRLKDSIYDLGCVLGRNLNK